VDFESQVLHLRTGIDLLERHLTGLLDVPVANVESCATLACGREATGVGQGKSWSPVSPCVDHEEVIEDVRQGLQSLCSDTRELGEHLQHWAAQEEDRSRLAYFDGKLQELLEERLISQDLRTCELQAQFERRMIDWQEIVTHQCSSLADTHTQRLSKLEHDLQERVAQQLAALELQAGDSATQLGSAVHEMEEAIEKRCSALALDCKDECLQRMQESLNLQCQKLEEHRPRCEALVEEVISKLSESGPLDEVRDDLCTQAYAVEVQQQRLAALESRFSKLEEQMVANTEGTDTWCPRLSKLEAQMADNAEDADRRLRDEIRRIEVSVAEQLERMGHEQDKEKALACKHSELHVRELRLELERRCDSVLECVESRLAEYTAPERSPSLRADAERRSEDSEEQVEQSPSEHASPEQIHPAQVDVERRCQDLLERFEQRLVEFEARAEACNMESTQQRSVDISLAEQAAAEVWKHAEQEIRRIQTDVRTAFDAHVQEVDSQIADVKNSLCALASFHRSDAEMTAVKSRLDQLQVSVGELEVRSRSHTEMHTAHPSSDTAAENLRRQLQRGPRATELRVQLEHSLAWRVDDAAKTPVDSRGMASSDGKSMHALMAGVLQGVEQLTPSLPETASEDQALSHQHGPLSPAPSLPTSPPQAASLVESPPAPLAQVERLGIFERLARLKAQASALEALEAGN